MESKKYNIPQKLVIGLITLIFVGLPIAIWVWQGLMGTATGQVQGKS
jgi:hypothetical protein